MSNGGMVDNRRGAILLIMSAAIFTADVTALRYLSPDVPFVLIIFFRSLLQLLIVTAYIRKQAGVLFMSPRWPMLVTRGITSLVCWWLYYLSFKKLDLALASTLTFTTSLFVVLLAPFVLREKIGPKRAIATILGFIGVVLASEIDGYGVNSGVLLGLGSAFAAAILIFQNRLLVKTEHTATIMFWIGMVATIGTTPGAILGWTFVSMQDLVLLCLAGALGTFGMLLTVEAYRFGEVSALAPFPYTRILFALGAGYFLFAERVSPYEITGAVIIVICGLIASERRKPSMV